MHESVDELPDVYFGDPATRERYCPEVCLWRAVIMQAFYDMKAMTLCSENERYHVSLRARTWLLRDGSDFQEVCLQANLNPSVVRERAVKIADEVVKLPPKPKTNKGRKSD